MTASDPIVRRDLLRAIRSKVDAGGRITLQERAMLVEEELVSASNDIQNAMNACMADPKRNHAVQYTQGTHDGIRRAFTHLVAQVYGIAAANADKRDALENRIVELEKRLADGADGKLRVVAGNRS